MNGNGIRFWSVVTMVGAAAWLAGCADTAPPAADDDPVVVVRGALDPCVAAPPVVVETREEQPGPVAPGISKIYFVTVRNADSATCGPSTITFTPDQFHFFSIVPQPSTIGGVSPGATAQFRVVVTADASVPPSTTVLGYTLIKGPITTTARGSLTLTVTFDNPNGCNRQRLAIAIDNPDPPPVPQGTVVPYHVTVRNVDNRECGQDVFRLVPDPPNRFETVTTDGPFLIFPQGSAVFTLTVQAVAVPPGQPLQQCFTVSGDHHATANLTSSACVRYRTQ